MYNGDTLKRKSNRNSTPKFRNRKIILVETKRGKKNKELGEFIYKQIENDRYKKFEKDNFKKKRNLESVSRNLDMLLEGFKEQIDKKQKYDEGIIGAFQGLCKELQKIEKKTNEFDFNFEQSKEEELRIRESSARVDREDEELRIQVKNLNKSLDDARKELDDTKLEKMKSGYKLTILQGLSNVSVSIEGGGYFYCTVTSSDKERKVEFCLKENPNNNPDEEFECTMVNSDIDVPGIDAFNQGKSILFAADQLNLLYNTIAAALEDDEN